MWGVILGICLVVPFVIHQLMKVNIAEGRKADVITGILASIGVILISFF